MTTEKKSDTLLLVEMKYGPLELYIPKWWVEQEEPSRRKLATHLGVSMGTITAWLDAYGFSDERVLHRRETRP